jgi:hypothetical protein
MLSSILIGVPVFFGCMTGTYTNVTAHDEALECITH